MKSFVGALALASLCMTPLTARAQDCPPCEECPLGPPAAAAPSNTELAIQDEDDDKVFGEVEVLLNQVLLVDESGRIVMREEFRSSLPIPAERVEGMLGQFVELGDDGKLHVKDREAIRPYLPMIRGFLGNGLNRLRDLQKLPPEERRDAMRRLFGNRGQPEETPQAEKAPEPETVPEARPERDRRMARREERNQDEDDRPRARRPRGEDRRAERDGDRDAPRGSVEQRLARIERQLGRIERMLADGGRDRARRSPAVRQGGLLRRLLEGRRPQGDRDRGRGRRDEGRRGGLRDMLDRGRTWRDGMRRLFELMEPEDFSALRDGLGALSEGGFDSEALRDPTKIMGRLQEQMKPEDAARFMEIFGEFIATPEGRAFADEMEDTVARMEEFMNSDRGERLGDMMRRFEGGGGDRGQLRDRIEELLGGRGRRDRADQDRSDHPQAERRSARRRHAESDRRTDRAPGNPPSGSKLY